MTPCKVTCVSQLPTAHPAGPRAHQAGPAAKLSQTSAPPPGRFPASA